MRTLTVAAAVATFAPCLGAQRGGPDPSIAITYVAPVAALGRYVTPGWGAEGALVWSRHSHPLALRVGAAYAAHRYAAADGTDSLTTLPTRVQVSTGSTRLVVTAGPALTKRLGRAGAQIHAGAGLAYASTTMGLSGLGIDERYTRRKRYTDLTVALQAGVGFTVRVSPGLDLTGTVTHTTVGPTRYGLDPVIRVGVISGPYWQPVRRWSQLVTVQLGATLGGH
jgi:hypothetical protein